MLLPMSLTRSMAGLAKFSMIGILAILLIIGCVLGVGPTLEADQKGIEPIVYFRAGGLGTSICILSFAYLCQHALLLSMSSNNLT